MSTLTFDTLKFAQRLEKAGATREYAIAEAEALSEIFESGTQELATKADILATKTDLKADISQLRAEMREMELRMTIKVGGMIAASIAVTAALVKLL
ncbi:MAG: hypothetical protein Q7U78_11760 [Gallionella sp.]|nr:hypothetical protein [Gallionella sp.]